MKIIKYAFFTMLLASSIVTVHASDHAHVWADEWTYDSSHHWHDCVMDKCDLSDKTQKGAYAEHTFTVEKEDDAHLYCPQTCSNGARYYYECTVCGCLSKETFEVGTGNGEHVYSELYYANETSHWLNCIYNGCEEKISMGAHTFGNWVTTKEATTEEAGEATRTCPCGREETKAIPKLEKESGNSGGSSSGGSSGGGTTTLPEIIDIDPTKNNTNTNTKGTTAKRVELGILIGSGVFAFVMVGFLIYSIRKYK